MNFIIYNKTTGRIDQTGYTLWEAPAASPEYTAAQKSVQVAENSLNDLKLKANGLSVLIENDLEDYNTIELAKELSLLQEQIEQITIDTNSKEQVLTLLKEIELETYNKAKTDFLDSMCEETQTAIEGIADASVQQVQISDKTLINREPDPIPFGNINRSRRDSLLNLSDWTQVPDSPLSSLEKENWKSYRAALRDLSDTVETFETAELSYSDLPVKPQ